MKKTILTFIFTAFISLTGNSHPWKPEHYVVIDTDCGLDDFRAIRVMLESSNIRILAITVSNGVVNAEDGFNKIKDLLYTTHHEGILVGANNNTESKIIHCKAAKKFRN
ncbi:MAG TPA: nucleoside hydrolase [Bacteroidales bacterium]|nr:nucleoside hydrolase [Bacteroidales bacterium]